MAQYLVTDTQVQYNPDVVSRQNELQAREAAMELVQAKGGTRWLWKRIAVVRATAETKNDE